jgi:hypothetical protein
VEWHSLSAHPLFAVYRPQTIYPDRLSALRIRQQCQRCQCRKARIQRNHIGCAFLVWVRLKELAAHTGRTVYQLKHGLLDDYLIQQLKNPSLKMRFA